MRRTKPLLLVNVWDPAGARAVVAAGSPVVATSSVAMAAARDGMDGGIVVAVDIEVDAVERVAALGLCDLGVAADLRDPLGAFEALRAADVPPADLTVVVVNASGCEPTAILLTADDGTALFFSMATNFASASLAADGAGSNARMLVGSGYSPDGGRYALDLVRRSQPLRQALGVVA